MNMLGYVRWAALLLSMPLLSSAAQPAAVSAVEMPMPAAAPARNEAEAEHDVPLHTMHDDAALAGATTRSADYSTGVSSSMMPGMEMTGRAVGMLRVNQLEAFHGHGGSGLRWEVEGWYGKDLDKLGLRSEGERRRGNLEDADLEIFWSHAVAPYWNTQLGMRQDLGEGPKRSWAAFGVQGLAPYWFELQATGYLDVSGRTAARVRADYELLFTQRLILQPEMEMNLYGKSDSVRRLGAGLTDVQLGLRLRYEIHRRFAPYLGVNWTRRLGATASYARQDNQPVAEWQLVGGVRFWF